MCHLSVPSVVSFPRSEMPFYIQSFDIFHRMKMIAFIINVALYIEIRLCSQRVC